MQRPKRCSRPPRNWLAFFWLPLGLIVAGVIVSYATWRTAYAQHSDLLGFQQTTQHWLETGEFTPELGVIFYLPSFTVLMAPVTAWPPAMAAFLLAALNVLLLVLCVQQTGRQIARTFGTSLPSDVFWLWPIVLVLPFAGDTIVLGQVNLIVLFLCLLALRQLSENKDTKAGFAIALAGAIKLYPLLLLLPLVLRSRYRAVISACVGFVVLTAGVSLAAFGWQGSIEAHRHWLAEVRGQSNDGGASIFSETPGRNLRYNNQSLAAVIRRSTTSFDLGGKWMSSPLNLSIRQAKALHATMAATLLLFLTWRTWKRRKQNLSLAEWSAWLTGIVALLPIYWTHYFILLLPAVSLLAVSVWLARQQNAPYRLPAVLLALWLIALPLMSHTPRWLGVHCWLAIAITLWTATTTRVEPPQPPKRA